MIGERLAQANRIAAKRAARPGFEWVDEMGKLRKWNGTCGCTCCRFSRIRYKRKGFSKRKWRLEG